MTSGLSALLPPKGLGVDLVPNAVVWLASGAVALAALALGLEWVGHSAAASVLAVMAATSGLSVAAIVFGLSRNRRQGERLSRDLAQLLAFDPDPVYVTDSNGCVLGANQNAADIQLPAARLNAWCVEPDVMIEALLAEVIASGHTTREFRRSDKSLRVSAYRVDRSNDLIFWRFSSLSRCAGRTLDALGLPVVSFDGDRICVNAAARPLIDPSDALGETLVAAVADGPADVVIPGGTQVQALGVPARDGWLDVVLLSPGIGLHTRVEASSPGHDFDDIPVALAQLEPDGRIAGSNRLARQLLGLSPGEVRFFWEVVEGLGRPVSDWLDDANAGRALGRPEVLRATLTAQETYVQIILRRGREGALVAVISDATELKSLEARFVQSQKMQAIGQLAGGIAHDFNNLLTAIAGHCDLLLLNRDRFDPDYEDLLQIHQNSNRAAAMVRQLLAFSRKQTLKTEILTLEGLLEDLTHLLTRLVGERITLTLHHGSELGAIRADRRQLEQVIMNLVVNARDAMPMGGVIRIETQALSLTHEREHGRARIPPGDYALIRVIDKGMGIPADINDKIFEPFFTTKKVGEGTGLGLSTAYGIVKQMGGYIFCDSIEGVGTTFTLYFAMAEPAAATKDRNERQGATAVQGKFTAPLPAKPALPRAPAPVLPARPGLAILLVEDEAPVRAFASRALRYQGYQVYEAQDGEQALEFLEDPTIHIDLFLTDVIMPGIDGPGWVSQALAQRPNTPVVFVSGYTEDTLSAALTRIPRAVFLGKPFSLSDLTETIARQIAA